MNKNLKIITINGVRGMLMAVFIIFGLISGFIISPAWVCMKLWNTFVVNYAAAAPMNMYQGLLSWTVIALILYALNNKRALIGFGSYPKLSNEQIKEIIRKSKMSNSAIFPDFESLQNSIKNEIKENINDINTANENTVKKDSQNEQQEEIRG